MTNPYDPYSPFAQPTPEQNRAAWLAANPGARPVDPAVAEEQVAANLGAGVPNPGVSGQQLGEQMAAQGAHAGLPAEDDHDAEMAAMRAIAEDQAKRLAFLEKAFTQQRQAYIAALGEPIVERYAKGVRDKLRTHLVMHPALAEHLEPRVRLADNLYEAARKAVSGGGNDFREVAAIAQEIDRYVTKTHGRVTGGSGSHVDFSALLYDLELMLEEAAKQHSAVVPAG